MTQKNTFKNVPSFLWEIIKPYRYHYLLIIIAQVYTGITDLIFFYSAKLFIDVLTQETFVYQNMIYPITILISNPIILNIVHRISNIAEWKAEPYVKKEILLKSYSYVQNHSFSFFQNYLSGNILSKIKGLLEGYDLLFSQIMKDVLLHGTILLSGLIAFLTINHVLGLFFTIWFFVFFTIFFIAGKKLDTLSFIENEAKHNIIASIADKITNILSIFYFSTKEKELRKLNQQITEDFIPKQVRTYKYDFIFQLIQWSLYFTMWMCCVFILIKVRVNNLITIGDIAFVFGMMSRISDSTWLLSRQMQDFMKFIGDFRSSFEILRISHKNIDEKSLKKLAITTPSIEFKDVQFCYDDGIKVFDKLNIKIKPGENLGLVGYSGSGKTSIVNILLRYFEIQRGSILIDNQNIAGLLPDSIRSSIAVIPQDIVLFHRSLMENIRYGNLNANDEEVITAAKKAHIHEFIVTLPKKYNTSVGEKGLKLSGGQRQRIAIARAILKNAPILILDEATSSLDSKTEKYIQNSINYILNEKKKTVIAIAHRLSTLKYMNKILVLDKGKIVEEGTHDELLNQEQKNSFYKRLWDEQVLS